PSGRPCVHRHAVGRRGRGAGRHADRAYRVARRASGPHRQPGGMTALTAEFVERQYNLRAAFPDHLAWFERWAADSEKARSRLDNVLDVRYGRGPKQTLDLFPAANPRGLLLFLHGGYWRALDKADHSFIAPEFVARGIGVAVVNYDLCPDVGIARIVDECREGVVWLRHGG